MPSVLLADKVSVYRQKQQAKFNWNYVTPQMITEGAPEMFYFWVHDVISEWPETVRCLFFVLFFLLFIYISIYLLVDSCKDGFGPAALVW